MATEPTVEIAVTLEAQEWNLVLECLADGRFRLVAPLIQKIVNQAQPPNESTPQQLRPRPVGGP